MRSWLMMMLAGVLLTPLAGCNQTSGSATSVCSVWRPITWSSQDTPETVDQVKGGNSRRKAWCS